MKMVLEENSFMVNYVNDKLSAYNNDTMLPRASSVIGVTTDGHEVSITRGADPILKVGGDILNIIKMKL